MFIDITRPLCPTTAVWPGDLATTLRRVSTISQSSLVTTHELHCSLHAATHLDAPSHYDPNGATIDRLDPSLFVGPCTVVRLPDPCPDPITPGHLQAAFGAEPPKPRLLLATHAWDDTRHFPRVFPTLSADAPAYLASLGVRLLGLDVPSVDKFPAATIPIHLELNRHGILILESLDLRHARTGHYELIALPLRMPGVEASPVRALLRPLGDG